MRGLSFHSHYPMRRGNSVRQKRAEQASNPGKREHPAPSAGRSVGKGVDQRGADDAAAILDRATRAETAPARSEIPEGRRRRALWVRSLPMTMTRNLC